MNAPLRDRLFGLLDGAEALLVALEVGGQGADDPLEVAGAGEDARGDHALRRQQVDEIEDELFAGMGDAQQVGVAASQLVVADLDVETLGGLGHSLPPLVVDKLDRTLPCALSASRGCPLDASLELPPVLGKVDADAARRGGD